MSQRFAASCAGKKRHASERIATEVAKMSGTKFGVAMNAYPCSFCKAWHVGTTRCEEARNARIVEERRIRYADRQNIPGEMEP